MIPLIFQAFQLLDIREVFLVLTPTIGRLEKEAQQMAGLFNQECRFSILLAYAEFSELLDPNDKFIQLFERLDCIGHILLGSIQLPYLKTATFDNSLALTCIGFDALNLINQYHSLFIDLGELFSRLLLRVSLISNALFHLLIDVKQLLIIVLDLLYHIFQGLLIRVFLIEVRHNIKISSQQWIILLIFQLRSFHFLELFEQSCLHTVEFLQLGIRLCFIFVVFHIYF